MDIWPLWTGLIPKFSVSLLQRQDTTVSLGTKPFICSKKAVFPLSANVIVWKEWARLNYSSKQSLIIKSVGHKIKLSTFTWCLTSKSHHLKTSLRLNSHGLPFRPHFPSTTVSWWTWNSERKKKRCLKLQRCFRKAKWGPSIPYLVQIVTRNNQLPRSRYRKISLAEVANSKFKIPFYYLAMRQFLFFRKSKSSTLDKNNNGP